MKERPPLQKKQNNPYAARIGGLYCALDGSELLAEVDPFCSPITKMAPIGIMENAERLVESLSGSFNYATYTNRCQVLASCVRAAIEESACPKTLLDIGCGEGMERQPSLVASLAARTDRFWGIEPDIHANVAKDTFDRVWRSTLEQADLPAESVDVAYSCMVAEHVECPAAFVNKLYAVLKPTGRFFMLTINGRSYLGRIAKWANRFRLQEVLLQRAVGKQVAEQYHYSAFYRFNTARLIAQIARAAGFSRAQFIYLENGETTRFYWPRGLGWIGRTIDWKHRVLRQTDRFNNLLAVLTK